MLGRRRQQSAGDTLIEVMFATGVFSLVAVGGLAVMNQGSAASERGLEISLVRDQMDAQADTLRFLNSSYVTAFQSGQPGANCDASTPSTPAGQWALMSACIKAHPIGTLSTLGVSSCPTSYKDGSFILNPQLAQFENGTGILQPAKTYAQLTYSGTTLTSSNGIWIEGVRYDPATSGDANQSNIGYIDFHIFACWDSPDQPVPVTLGTIVRLYEPR